jgi:catechol 2,3-dioxygenase-like lactoylglutathione lyase family enzyme
MTRLRGIAGFRLVTTDPEHLARFYNAIGFTIGAASRIPSSEMALLSLAGGGTRTVLRLGLEQIGLDSFDHPGRPIPSGGTVADTLFQHFAIVTSDVAAAWDVARAHGARPISSHGAVTLPRSSGGVTAIKFRDPEGHPLEFLQFPPEAATRWRGTGPLGIDHSAISVADTAMSAIFYTALGLRVSKPTRNHGSTQDALDGLTRAIVAVVPLIPDEGGPHLELLGYRSPIGRPARWMPNDIAATRIVWQADGDGLVADPDGHLHQLSR